MNDTKRRSVELEFELPGTPEQIWQAIATGPGISAWFVPSEVEERPQGKMLFHLGPGMDSPATITKWQPPRLLRYEEAGWMNGAPTLATEFHVETSAGGTCRVRLVHSLPTDASDWDDELGSMEKGWPPFFEVLRLYLSEHQGQDAFGLRLMRSAEAVDAGAEDRLWHGFVSRLGLATTEVGGEFRLAVNDAPELLGRIVAPRRPLLGNRLLIQLRDPAPGTLLLASGKWGDQVHVSCDGYLYGSNARARVLEGQPAWEAWMAATSET